MKTKEIKEQLERVNDLMNDAESIIELKSYYQDLLEQEKAKDKSSKSYGQLEEERYQKEINRCVKNIENILGQINKVANEIVKLT